jgi:hypothetical protein
MPDRSSQIEVAVIDQAAVVRFRRTHCLLMSVDPMKDVGEELFALFDTDHHSIIILSFDHPDIHWLSCAFEAVLVRFHVQLSRANGVLKLCNVPEPIMGQFRMNRLIELFNIYPDVEEALKSDT